MKTESQHQTFLVPRPRHHVWFHSFVAYTFCFGYICMGRGFAGLHIPGVPIYVGEVLLVMSCVYIFKEFNRTGFTSFQMILLLPLSVFSILILKDSLFRGHDLMYVFRDSATVYYLLFLLLYSSRGCAPFFTRIIDVLSKYHLLVGLSLLLHSVLGAFWATFLVIGDDIYGLFHMPGCLVPPLATFLIVVLSEKRHLEKVNGLELASISFSIGAIILCQSRGGILGALVALAYYICFLVKGRVRFISQQVLAFILIAIIILSLGTVIRTFQERLFEEPYQQEFRLYSMETLFFKFQDLVDPQGDEYKGSTGQGRLDWWRVLIEYNLASMETLIFGQGFGKNLGECFNYSKENTRCPHNAWLTIFGWSGLIGALMYFIVFSNVYLFLTAARMRLNGDEHSSGRLACNTGLVFLIAVIVSSMFDTSLSSPVTEIPLYIYLGCTVSIVQDYYPGRIWKSER